jgi:hypothetical protein
MNNGIVIRLYSMSVGGDGTIVNQVFMVRNTRSPAYV